MKGRCRFCNGIIHSNPFRNNSRERCKCQESFINDNGDSCAYSGGILFDEFKTYNKFELELWEQEVGTK